MIILELKPKNYKLLKQGKFYFDNVKKEEFDYIIKYHLKKNLIPTHKDIISCNNNEEGKLIILLKKNARGSKILEFIKNSNFYLNINKILIYNHLNILLY